MNLLPRLLVLCVGLYIGGLPGTVNAATAGRTVGNVSVGSMGDLSYSIPIWAPPGPHQLQPNIQLTYDSNQGNNYVGAGWVISGISSISRCNQTVAQDGAAAGVTLSTSDALCLDGQRLQVTSGTPGTAGSTYQTEIANFENVTAYSSVGNGPAYFIVQAPNGTQYEYGNPANSSNAQVMATGTTTASAWMLDKVTDTYGNTMVFTYMPAVSGGGTSPALTGTTVPVSISWTPTSHGATSYQYTMAFSYSSTANALQSSISGYVAGTVVTNTELLSSIAIKATLSGTTSVVKQYNLSYTAPTGTGRDLLASVTECADGTMTNCLLPSTFTYQSTTPSVSTASTTVANASFGPISTYDFNGDGIKDILFQSGSTWYVAFGTSTGYSTPVSTGINTVGLSMASGAYGSSITNAGILVGDVLGTHHDGILLMVYNGSGYTFQFYSWNGSSFAGVNTGYSAINCGSGSFAAPVALANIRGNGLPDLVTECPSGHNTNIFFTNQNTSTGGVPSFSSSAITAFTDTAPVGITPGGGIAAAGTFTGGELRVWDFDGDGREDIFYSRTAYGCLYLCGTGHDIYGSANQAFELLGQSNGTFNAIAVNFSGAEPYAGLGMEFVNFNSDKCTDITIGSLVYVSACNGATASQVTLAGTLLAAIDVDGDGRTDAVIVNPSTGNVGVQFSQGSGVSSTVADFGIPAASSGFYGRLDIGGTGLDTLACLNCTKGTFNYYSRSSPGTLIPDVLLSATDGFGNSVQPGFVTLYQSTNSHYTYTGAGPLDAEDVPDTSPHNVVGSVTFSDPSASGASYVQTHTYTNAWTNLQGRGFEGFSTHQMVDSRNQVAETWSYGIPFPYTGMVVADVTAQTGGSGPTISNLSATPASMTLSSGTYPTRDFPYFSSQTLNQYEVGGTKNGQLITTTVTNYNYDAYDNPTSVSTVVTDEDSGSPYYGKIWTTAITNTTSVDTTHWCLNLYTQMQIAHTSTDGGVAVTQLKTMPTPDTSHCDYPQIVSSTVGGSSSVTETIGYDAFGNVYTDAITGSGGMATRTSTANWGTTGQLPISVTDASGAQTQTGYDYRYGLPNSVTDPNGVITTEVYGDGFGRLTQQNRPDGTYTIWVYTDMTGIGYSLHGLVANQETYSSGGSFIRNDVSLYDPVGRPVGQVTENIAGGYNQYSITYNPLGFVASRSAPCSWTGWITVCPYFTTAQYDTANRLINVQPPVSPGNSSPQPTAYKYLGRTRTIVDANGNSTSTVSDVNGWARQTQDALGYTVTTGYDAAGNKVAVTDNLSNTLWSGTYAYGAGAFLSATTDMDLGTWTYTPDALGEASAWHDAKGNNFSMVFDNLGRPISRTEPDLYTSWTWGSTPTSHNVGQLAAACTGTGTTCSSSAYSETDSFDSLGRPYQRSITLPSGTYTYTRLYNSTTGLPDTLTYPVSTAGYSLQLKYGYQHDILQSVTDISDTPNVAVWTANSTNVAGQITQETLGNNVVTSRAFDAVTGWLNSVQSGVGGGYALQNQGFLADQVGNLTQRQDNNLGLTENSYYDADYRLTSTKLNSAQNLAIGYDQMGNITSRSDIANAAAWTYDPTHKHQATTMANSGLTYTYDANGNVTNRGGSSINWSSYNYPTYITATSPQGSETVWLTYGPDRSRWQQQYSLTGINKTSSTTYYIGGLLDEVIGSATTYRHYIYAGSEPVAVYARSSSGSNTLYYLLSDPQGNVANITSSAGSSVVAESYTPFGERRSPSTWANPTLTSLGWTNQISSADAGASAAVTSQGYTFQTELGEWMNLNHMNGRVQDAVSGRFLSADPNIPDATNSQEYNRYSYVDNDPLTYIDPSGFYSTVCVPYNPPGNGTNISADNSDQSSGLQEVIATGERLKICYSVPDLSDLNNQSYFQNPIRVVSFSGITTGDPPPQPTQCGPKSIWPHGGGLAAGGSLELGLPGLAGAAGQISTGVGAFHSSTTGWSGGTFDSGGAVAYFGSHVAGAPAQSSPWVAGGSVGGGAFAFFTNAQSVQQLKGPFSTTSFNLGFGPFQFSLNVATGGGVWVASLSPPIVGETFGISGSKITTNTTTSTSGCP